MTEPDSEPENDIPETMLWMMERDALYSEMQRWEADVTKYRKEEDELDKVLVDQDGPRLTEVQQLEKQIGMMLSAVHYDGADNSPDSFIGEELPLKTERLLKLMDDGGTAEWSRRRRLHELIRHCAEEIERCKDQISSLEFKLRPYEEQRKQNSQGIVFNPEAIAQSLYDDPPEPWEMEDHRTEVEIQRDDYEMELDILQEASEWERMSSEREVRKKVEEIQRIKQQNLYEYIDQLEGLVESINEDWQNAVQGLEDDLVGRTIDVYFNGKHPKECLALRYKEDLGATPKWEVDVLRKQGNNKFTVRQTFPPYKEYLMSLGKDKRNHHFAFNFLSFDRDWFEMEKKVGPNRANWKNLRTAEFYQEHDRIAEAIRKKKANG